MQDIFKIFYSALLVGLVREAAAGTFGLQPVVMIKSLPRKCVGPLMLNTESHVGYRQPHLQEHLLVKSLYFSNFIDREGIQVSQPSLRDPSQLVVPFGH